MGKEGAPLTPQAVNDRVKKHNLLRVKTKAGRNGYPTFQFADGGVHANIRVLLHILLGAEMSEWGVAFWLTEPMKCIDGKRPIDVLDDPEAFELVLARAKVEASERMAAR